MQYESDKFTTLAQIGKPVGLAGQCRIVPYGDTISDASYPLKRWVGTNRSIEQITLTSVKKANGDLLKGQFEGINDRDAIDRIKNLYLYLETALLPEPEEDEYYFHQLIGLKVESETGEILGSVVDAINLPTTDAVEIKVKSGKKVLYPFRKETVSAVSIEDNKITIDSSFLEDLL